MKKLIAVLIFAFGLTIAADVKAQTPNGLAQDPKEQKEAVNYDVYVGQYEVSPGFILTMTHENGKLIGQPTGDVKAEFKPEKAADEFFSSVVGARLRFARNPAGEVIAVVVTIEGKDFYSKKIK